MKNKSLKKAILKMLNERSDNEVASYLKELREDAITSLDYYYAGEGVITAADEKYLKLLDKIIDSQIDELSALNKKHLTQLIYINKIYKNYPKDLEKES